MTSGNGNENREAGQFTYADVLAGRISYVFHNRLAYHDTIELRLSDQNFSTRCDYRLRRTSTPNSSSSSSGSSGGRPFFSVNKPLRIYSRKSKSNGEQIAVLQALSTSELDVHDDDSAPSSLTFRLLARPQHGGRVERVSQPGRTVDTFTYDELVAKRICYVLAAGTTATTTTQEDWFKVQVSDDTFNQASAIVRVQIVESDDAGDKEEEEEKEEEEAIERRLLASLKPTMAVRAKELGRKRLTRDHFLIRTTTATTTSSSSETIDREVRFVVTNPPEYGTLERKESGGFVILNEFTLAELSAGLVYYRHRSPGAERDKFGFVITLTSAAAAGRDASSTPSTTSPPPASSNDLLPSGLFNVDNVHTFSIQIVAPRQRGGEPAGSVELAVVTNVPFEYLQRLSGAAEWSDNGLPGRWITRNELLAVLDDDDDEDDDSEQHAANKTITYRVTRPPSVGLIAHKERSGQYSQHSLDEFTQRDIDEHNIYYVIRHSVALNESSRDSFEFDVRQRRTDSSSSVESVRPGRTFTFHIEWSTLGFAETETSVMESEGRVRVYVRKTGNLREASSARCRTESGTAVSNKDAAAAITSTGAAYDFVHASVKVEFDEDESYKACDIMLYRDQLAEPVEYFWVVLDEPRQSLVGPDVATTSRIKVNILDRKRRKKTTQQNNKKKM